MVNKTARVKELVQDVLATLAEPYDEDITLEVCMAIEKSSEWCRRYKDLVDEMGTGVVNSSIGQFVKAETGLNSLRVVSAKKKSKLIKSYTKLGRA